MGCYCTVNSWTIYKNATGDMGVVKSTTVLNADGTIKNLTDLSMILQVWKGDPTQPLLSSVNVASDSTPTDGVVNWTVSASDIAALPYSLDGLKIAIRFIANGYQDTTDPFTLLVVPSA